ncbi:MAG: DUF4367 domain-containing protein [Oscillospiraceae bacterium]|nr:DUF4367 domain-containing protein [Oscillospiraceae bacterium]
MSKKPISDKQLDKYICEAAEAMLASLPKAENCEEPALSPQFEAKMTKLFEKMEGRKRIQIHLRRVAAVFILIILGSGAFIGLNSEARAEFGGWLRASYEGSIIYRFLGESPQAPMPEIEFGWLPEGCELILKDELENSLTYIYECGDEGFIFSCNRMTENNLTQLFPKDTDICKEVSIKGVKAEMWISENGLVCIVWTDDKENFIYTLESAMSEYDILHIAEEIKTAN